MAFIVSLFIPQTDYPYRCTIDHPHKIFNMFTVQQEIVLFTNNSFSQKQWCDREINGDREITEGSRQLSSMEQLEAACWNGLLGELLPEIVEHTGYGKKLFLWQIRKGRSSLHIQLSESTVQLDEHYSIDPSLFLTDLLLNN